MRDGHRGRCRRRIGEDLAEPVGAGLAAEEDEAAEQGQPAGAGDEQGVERGGPCPDSVCRLPISRNDVIDVSSQHV